MGLRDWLLGGPPVFRSGLLQAAAPVPEQRAQYLDGYQVALTSRMLVHGPGATDILNGANGSDGNSAVFACLRAISECYIEAPLRVWRERAPGQRAPLPRHPLQRLLDTPNPFMSALEVWGWVQWAKHLDGNAYLRKIRSGGPRGNVVELWPLSPARMEVRGTDREFITEYRYHYAPGKYEAYAPDDILHFRLGLDDRNHRLGLAPLRRLVRAITTDERAAEWTDTLLGNGAVAGMTITTDQELTVDQAQEIKERAEALYGGANKGRTAVFGKGAHAQPLGFNPEQMLLKELHNIPESRITAVMRVPAIVAGLGVGLEAATYSNYGQAREAFTETTLASLWAQDAAKVQARLVPEFTSDRSIVTVHDLSDVRAFQEDEGQRFQRLHQAVGGPWMTPNEARAEAGMLPLPDGDVLFVPVNVVATPTDDLSTPPLPAPAPVTDEGATDADADAPIPLRQAASRRQALVADVVRQLTAGKAAPLTAADTAAALAYWADDPTVGPLLGARTEVAG
jgi:HK97 family phage portal protein